MKHLLLFIILTSQISFSQESVIARELIKKALVYEENGDVGNAIATYLRVMIINPKNFQSANAIAGLYGTVGDAQNEILWAKNAIAINPKYCLGYII